MLQITRMLETPNVRFSGLLKRFPGFGAAIWEKRLLESFSWDWGCYFAWKGGHAAAFAKGEGSGICCGSLDEKTLLFAKLIRDADKCDIFRVFAQENPVDTTGFSAEQVGQEAVSDVVYESILGHYCIKKQERKTGLDVWVSFLSFFFDLNFAESLRIVLKQGYYKKRFLELNFEDPATEERVRRCIAETEQYAYARLRMEELQ